MSSSKPYSCYNKWNSSHSFPFSSTMPHTFWNKDTNTPPYSTAFPKQCKHFLWRKVAFSLCLSCCHTFFHLDTLLAKNPNAIKVKTKTSNDTVLHLFVLSNRNGILENNSLFSKMVKLLNWKITMHVPSKIEQGGFNPYCCFLKCIHQYSLPTG